MLTVVAAGAVLLLLIAIGRIASRNLWQPAAAASVAYERADTHDPSLVRECMRVSGQLISCAVYRRHATPHVLLVYVADGSAALTLPLSEFHPPPDRKTFVTIVSIGDTRDMAPITFDGGFGQIHLTKDQIKGAAMRGITVNGISVSAQVISELQNYAQATTEK